MQDADGPVHLFQHHAPDVGSLPFLAFEEAIHGRRQDESIDGVVAGDLARPPGIAVVGEGDGQLLLGAIGPHEAHKLLLVLITMHDIGLDRLGQMLADAAGHVQGIAEGHLLPAIMIGGDLHVVGQFELVHLVAILLGQAQQGDGSPH